MVLFAVPIFFGNLFQLFYSLTDTRIVGTYLGEEALAAVGGTSVLSNLMIGFMNGMTLGFAVPMARFYGGRKLEKLKKAFALAVGMGTLLCVFLITVCLLCMDSLMAFMQIEPHLLTNAKSYCTVYWGVILAEPVVWILMVLPLIFMLFRSPYLKKNCV